MKALVLACGVLLGMPCAHAAERPPAERWSQLGDALFTQLNPDQGLPTRFTTSIAEDGDGFLWIGTSGGLARWDGSLQDF